MNDIQATMPVQPANNQPYPVFYGNGGNNGGFDGNNAWWVIILLLAMGRGWGGNGGGGYSNGSNVPYIINTSSSDNSGSRGRYDMQDGFNHAAVMGAVEGVRSSVVSGNGDTQLSIAGLGRQICETGANITASVTGAASAAEIAANQRAMAAMERSFNAQTAVDSRLDSMAMENQRCCCEQQARTAALEATVLRENCEDRYQAQSNTRDIIDNANRNNQAILDKLCQLELDGVKQNYENRIAAMQTAFAQERSAMQAALDNARTDNQSLRFDRSQVAQSADFRQSQSQQTADLLQRLNPTPIPAYVVQNPNCCNNQFYNGCGCGAA